MKKTVIPKEKRKTILLLSDDIRTTSGISTMSKSIVVGTAHLFNWIQLGAAIKHPQKGKFIDLSESVNEATGLKDASVTVIPWDGYGDQEIIRHLLMSKNPDAILHFTDPRQWVWLYQMEAELRQNIPILYYSIWDDLPDPLYNRAYYESSDFIGCISKQTHGIVKRLMSRTDLPTWETFSDWRVKYIPHGINENVYKPVEVTNEFKREIFGDYDPSFVFFWANRNIRRKKPADVIIAFDQFIKNLDASQKVKDSICLLMHTPSIDMNGTDLNAIVRDLTSGCKIIFSEKKRAENELNMLYNLADCTINIAGNEGFGLTTAESVMAGTPIIVNVTGGLQDQCGFKLNGKLLTADDYIQIGSLHEAKKWENNENLTHGEWAFPIWSRVRVLVGSVPTPYIWDDVVGASDLTEKMFEVYTMGRKELSKRGLIGRKAFINELGLTMNNMCNLMAENITNTLKLWKPRKNINIYEI